MILPDAVIGTESTNWTTRRNLVCREVLATMGNEHVGGRRAAGFADDVGLGEFSFDFVRHAGDRGQRHRWMHAVSATPQHVVPGRNPGSNDRLPPR